MHALCLLHYILKLALSHFQFKSKRNVVANLGMYLLVFRHEKPVTVRGCARYTKEKWTASDFLSGRSGITTADFQPVVGYHTFNRQSSCKK